MQLLREAISVMQSCLDWWGYSARAFHQFPQYFSLVSFPRRSDGQPAQRPKRHAEPHSLQLKGAAAIVDAT
jgi:hypothetical protein